MALRWREKRERFMGANFSDVSDFHDFDNRGRSDAMKSDDSLPRFAKISADSVFESSIQSVVG